MIDGVGVEGLDDTDVAGAGAAAGAGLSDTVTATGGCGGAADDELVASVSDDVGAAGATGGGAMAAMTQSVTLFVVCTCGYTACKFTSTFCLLHHEHLWQGIAFGA